MKIIDSPSALFAKFQMNLSSFCRCDFIVAFWMSVVLWLESLHTAIDSLNVLLLCIVRKLM